MVLSDPSERVLELACRHWDFAVERAFYGATQHDYFYKTQADGTPRKVVVKYEDKTIMMCVISGKSDKAIGYAIHIKPEVFVRHHDHHIMVMSNGEHCGDPELVLDLAPLRIVKFPTTGSNDRYWASTKRKETFL